MATDPTLDIAREIRFAVVMYGGVSLAIYINGVAQELLQLGTATAEDRDNLGAVLCKQPTGTAKTYRTVAQLLSMSEGERQLVEAQLAKSSDTPLETLPLPHRITVKFVIDTISGTSAGGINGIFLGKALANNQSLDQLQQMWIEEGDILKLINDKDSIRDLEGFPSPDSPESLLNGQRMYRRLVEALDEMDAARPSSAGVVSGYVEELDVFTTTTDVNGLPVFLRLSDGVVTERRYKNAFQFSYRQDEKVIKSDFVQSNNPFLAYAARCTSSFPVAFPPMRLEGIGEVLITMPRHRNEEHLGKEVDRWRSFFPAYRPSADIPKGAANTAWYEFEKRSFCDGGYLDNKPFSHAIDMLSQRVSRLPTDRKLIYIEPDPEHADLAKASNKPPNPIENALLSQSLATYETIREDLERVLERNRLIERVDRLLAGSDNDVGVWRKENNFDDRRLFLEGEFKDLLLKYGPSYGGYHRLKVSALTDEIGQWVGAAANFQPASAYVDGIRLLVRAWRERNYSLHGVSDERKQEPFFLYDFDLSYRIRRLRFVIRRLDGLRRAVTQGESLPDSQGSIATMSKQVVGQPETASALKKLRAQLHQALAVLIQAREQLSLPGNGNPLAEELTNAAFNVAVLELILEGRTFEERFASAQAAVQNDSLLAELNKVAEFLRDHVKKAAVSASTMAEDALKAGRMAETAPGQDVMQQMQDFYVSFQGYDFVSFPTVYATDVGEELSTTEVIRISPEDATSLVNRGAGDLRRKLAGTVLMHFGAFLEAKWRRNDMLWGRLDGAERLITALMPQNCPKLTGALVRDAQLHILEEYFAPMNSKALLQYSSEAVGQLGAPNAETRKLQEFFNANGGTRGASRLSQVVVAALQQSLGPQKLLEFFKKKDGYEVTIEPTATSSALALSRATTVLGRMLKKIGDDLQIQPTSKTGSWAIRAGQIMWGLVEVSMPGSLLRLLSQYWVKVAYLLETILIIGGFALRNEGAENLGWTLLALTLSANIISWLLTDWFAGRSGAIRIVKIVFGAVLLVFVAIGANTTWNWFVGLHLLEKVSAVCASIF